MEHDPCPICLEDMSAAHVTAERLVRIPCGHLFHSRCVDQLREFGVSNCCPMCRAALPRSPTELNDEASTKYFMLLGRVSRGETSWDSLSPQDQSCHDDVMRMWHEAADQGLGHAQHNLGVLYEKGEGVPANHPEAFRFYLLAAQQGDAKSQCNVGIMFYHGMGCEQSYERAREW
jgi:hypothetical protein